VLSRGCLSEEKNTVLKLGRMILRAVHLGRGFLVRVAIGEVLAPKSRRSSGNKGQEVDVPPSYSVRILAKGSALSMPRHFVSY
jgi:hypothetical protein